MSPRIGFFAAQAQETSLLSALEGDGQVAIQRSGTSYHLFQSHGDGEWGRFSFNQVSSTYTFRALDAQDLMFVSIPEAASTVTRVGSGWTVGATTFSSTPGDYIEFTGEGGALGVAPRFYANGGIVKVEIDGETSAANLLQTAQQWVDAGKLVNTALVANGGTLNPTDRILDTYRSGAINNLFTQVARQLGPGSHTARLTVTGYQNSTSSSNIFSYVTAATDLVRWGNSNTDITDPAAVISLVRWMVQNGSTLEYPTRVTPVGGTDIGYVSGSAHGYEEEVSFSPQVDGVDVVMADGDIIASTGSVGVYKHNAIHHPDIVDPDYLYDGYCHYALNAEGLIADITVDFSANGDPEVLGSGVQTASFVQAYIGKFSSQHMRRDMFNWPSHHGHFDEYFRYDDNAPITASLDNNSTYDAPTVNSELVFWSSSDDWASSWAMGHQVVAGPLDNVFFQDPSDGTISIDRAYPEVGYAGPVYDNTVWEATIKWCLAPFTNPDATFGS